MSKQLFFRYAELSESAKNVAYVTYVALVQSICFTHFETQEAHKHVYFKCGGYGDATVGGLELLSNGN